MSMETTKTNVITFKMIYDVPDITTVTVAEQLSFDTEKNPISRPNP